MWCYLDVLQNSESYELHFIFLKILIERTILFLLWNILLQFFFRKGQGIKVWLLLYPLRLSNPHSMQIWDRTNLSVLEPCLSSAASRSEPVQQCVGILFLHYIKK